jgi:hypothetical protein
MACVRSGQHTVAAPGDGRSARQNGPGPGHGGARFWDAGRIAQARPGQESQPLAFREAAPSEGSPATGPPAGLASRWPRRDARLPASGTVRRSAVRRHRAAAARGTRCAGPGHWLVLVIAWLASARGSWWPAVGGVVAGEHVPAPLAAGQTPPVRAHPREPLNHTDGVGTSHPASLQAAGRHTDTRIGVQDAELHRGRCGPVRRSHLHPHQLPHGPAACGASTDQV